MKRGGKNEFGEKQNEEKVNWKKHYRLRRVNEKYHESLMKVG